MTSTFYHFDYQLMYISKTSTVLLGIAVTIMIIGGIIHAFAAVIMKMQTLTMVTLTIIFYYSRTNKLSNYGFKSREMKEMYLPV